MECLERLEHSFAKMMLMMMIMMCVGIGSARLSRSIFFSSVTMTSLSIGNCWRFGWLRAVVEPSFRLCVLLIFNCNHK